MGQDLVWAASWTYNEGFLPLDSFCRGQHTILFAFLYFFVRASLSHLPISIALNRTIPEQDQAIKNRLNLDPGEKDDLDLI